MDFVYWKRITVVLLILINSLQFVACHNGGGSIVKWDECTMEYGILNESVPLTKEQEKSLGRLIFSYELYETVHEEIANSHVLFGGHNFRIKFKKGNITYLWHVSENGISRIIFENGEQIEKSYYMADEKLINELNSYRNQEAQQ
jgi:hypothetical protein